MMAEEPASPDLAEVLTGLFEAARLEAPASSPKRGAFTYEWVGGKVVRVIVGAATAENRAGAERLAQERG
jgi:hypothetical protein